MRGVSSLTIAASGGTAQAASSQTGKPGQTGGKPGTVPNYPVSERARAAACFNGKTGDKTGKPENRENRGKTGKTGDSTKLPRFRKGQSRRLLQRATWRARAQIPP